MVDIDKWFEEKYPNWKPTSLQKEFFRDAIEGKQTIGWWRGDRKRMMQAVFDYITQKRRIE